MACISMRFTSTRSARGTSLRTALCEGGEWARGHVCRGGGRSIASVRAWGGQGGQKSQDGAATGARTATLLAMVNVGGRVRW